jgi:DNA end-binding protein Ku
MPPRANWKGYLKLSLVTCPVGLFPTRSTKEKVSFHLINGATGNRVKQQYIDAETDEIVDRDEQVKGYEVAKGEYVTVTEEELAGVEVESSHTIDIESFVVRTEVDQIYLDQSYYIAPEGKVGQEAFAVIREAMRQRNVAGIARVVLHGRERLILLEPRAKGVLGTTLHHKYEMRSADAYFDEIPDLKIDKELLDLASHIIDTKKATFNPDIFNDRYQEAVIELIRSKQAGKKPAHGMHAPRPGNVINLMDALRRSLGSEKNNPSRTEKSYAAARSAMKPAASKPVPRIKRSKTAVSKKRIKKAS